MKIVQIGFNECGAVPLARVFRSGGLRVLFGDGAEWRAKGHPALIQRNAQLVLHANIRAGRSAFEGLETFQAFAGLEHAADGWQIENFRHFARMAEDAPDARFVLNTGHADDWLQARMTRDSGRFLDRAMDRTGMSRRGVLNLWVDDFHRHHDMVRAYFRDQPERLLEFDMQHTPVKDLARFAGLGLRLWPRRWPATLEAA